MAFEKMIIARVDAASLEAFQAAAAKRGTTVSDLLRGFVNLVGGAETAIPNRDQPLADLLQGKRKRKPDNRPLADLLKSH